MHWVVPVETIRALVPSALDLDLHNGVAYVGVVPFVMRHVRPWWSPAFLGFNFLETNVRTYVHHEGRPGVYFFSLDAASKLAVQVARRFWGLPYYHADMSCNLIGDEVCYQSVRRGSRARHEVRYRVGESLGPSLPGTLEFFLLERYLLFVERGDEIHVGQVHHTPYPIQKAEVLQIRDDLLSASGVDCCGTPPAAVHYSSGVDVEVFALQTVP